MSAVVNIQSYYGCERCKAASDIYGRSCKHGDFFPLLLIMGNRLECPNFEFDVEKVREMVKEETE